MVTFIFILLNYGVKKIKIMVFNRVIAKTSLQLA